MREPQITINGVTLNDAQAMTIRSAITGFLVEMSTTGALGEDETGEGIRKGYKARSAEIIQLMISPQPPQPNLVRSCIRCGGVEEMPEDGITCAICIEAIRTGSEPNGADRSPSPVSNVVGQKFVNIADGKIYTVVSEVAGIVTYESEDLTCRQPTRYLGRDEFEKRFQPAAQAHVMVSDEMVEAAARAMCDAWCYAPIGTPDGDVEWDRKQDQYRKQARAGLFAALSPSGAAE